MTTDTPPPGRLPSRLIVAVFAALFALLALGYFLFLRVDYVPAFTELRPSDASAIIAQLDGKHIAYRLSDGGGTILIPADQADQARVAIAGSDISLNGGVGFELFNKSDMGLTDFAQRINYQRALQGELERSIMMLDEIDRARVHLALPERTIFRSERSNAKAAVEVVTKAGRQLDEARVAGIQRLVAFAVPDLMPADVVILDGNGRVLSQSSGDDAMLSPDAEERQSVERYYRARARAAFAQVLPGIQADIRIMTLTREDGVSQPPPSPTTTVPTDQSPPAASRNFRLRVIVASSAPLNPEETSLARNAIASSVALNEAAGDELSFQIGLGPSTTLPAPLAADLPSVAAPGATVRPPLPDIPWMYWLAGAIGLLVTASVLVRLFSPRARLDRSERDAMVERIRAALNQPDSADAVA